MSLHTDEKEGSIAGSPKRIYIKTEPGGCVAFGELNTHEVQLLAE